MVTSPICSDGSINWLGIVGVRFTNNVISSGADRL